ncbi:MAG: hypothetical protein JSW23_03475 [Planctomycetota bacterium]|nr:MAG: hypothetical protein JSW23_03475 [Planctomycetota bacterium]
MDITKLKAFFLWCTIVNVLLLLLVSLCLLCRPFADFSYCMNQRFFDISRPVFNVILVSFIALYKICIMAFNLVPYIALVIITRKK